MLLLRKNNGVRVIGLAAVSSRTLFGVNIHSDMKADVQLLLFLARKRSFRLTTS